MDIIGRHTGQTFVIMGCGTSLTPTVIKRIEAKNVITIGVNSIFKIFCPDYHIHVDYWKDNHFSRTNNHNLQELIDRGCELFAPLNHDWMTTTYLKHVPFYSDHTVKFATSLSRGVVPLLLGHSSTSIYHALQLAVIMGAKKILLAGVDFYVPVENGVCKMHIYDCENKVDSNAIKNLEQRRLKFEYDLENKAKPELKRLNIEVFNLSRSSRLTAFPKLGLNEA
jgi:hypothetical protein